MVALLLTGLPLTASAEQARVRSKLDHGPFKVGAEVVTDFPLLFGGKLWTELPGRVRVNTSLGQMVGPYKSAVRGLVTRVGKLDASTARLVESALDSSLVWRINVGWRPMPDLGGYLDVGYTLMTLGGSASLEQLSGVAGLPLPAALKKASGSYDLQTRLHMINLEAGWGWRLWRGITLRAALGAAFTVGASTRISSPGLDALSDRALAYLATGTGVLDQTLKKYGITPTATLALGWQIWPF